MERDPNHNRREAQRRTGLLDSTPDAASERLLRLAQRALGASAMLFLVFGRDRTIVRSAVGREELRGRRFPSSDEWPLGVLAHGATVAVESVSAEEREGSEFVRETGGAAYAAAPVLLRGELVGCVCAVDAEARRWSHDDLSLLVDVADSVAAEAESARRRRRTKAQLRYDARHDPLTGLPNRGYFRERLARAVERARIGPDHRYAVLFLDLDRFKVVNDTLGHAAGDALLVEVARRLEASVRPGDMVARLGGDEFAILLHDIARVRDAKAVVGRVQERLREPVVFGEREFPATASVGIALGSGAYNHPDEIVRDADTAMYRAKALGPDRSHVFRGAPGRPLSA
jgi:diguanylate cyclase (GGDEF)-like protein